MSDLKKTGTYVPPVYKPATKEMFDWYDEYNQLVSDRNKDSVELQRLKDGLADAVIAFGNAVKIAQEKVDKLQKSLESMNDDIKDSDKDFLREFGENRYKIDWSKRV